jgi:hypothetical protein
MAVPVFCRQHRSSASIQGGNPATVRVSCQHAAKAVLSPF